MEETTNNNSTSNGTGEGSRWAWAVTGVVVLALIFGFYSWPKNGGETTQAPVNTEDAEADEYTASLENITGSDEVSDIEKDLQETNIDDLDKEVSDVEAEINAQ
ncbi:MAG: hypothetical protein HYV54_02010 [Parcubacteria group bacterium]|nr:hypothetical protein [Parcubacteria group bacterium]